MRRCASSGRAARSAPGSIRESSSSVAEPAMTPPITAASTTAALGAAADVGDPARDTPPSRRAGCPELPVGPCGCLPGSSVFGFADRVDLDVVGHDHRTRQAPVAVAARRPWTPRHPRARRRDAAEGSYLRRAQALIAARVELFVARPRRLDAGRRSPAHRGIVATRAPAGRQLSLPLPRDRRRRRARMLG